MGSYKTTLCSLTCDEPGCGLEFCDGASATNATVRRAARQSGWTYVPGRPTTGDPRDLCPRHAPQRPDSTEDRAMTPCDCFTCWRRAREQRPDQTED